MRKRNDVENEVNIGQNLWGCNNQSFKTRSWDVGMTKPPCYNRMLEEKLKGLCMQEDETSQSICNNLNYGFKMGLEGENLTTPLTWQESMLQNKLARGNILTTRVTVKFQHRNVVQHSTQIQRERNFSLRGRPTWIKCLFDQHKYTIFTTTQNTMCCNIYMQAFNH